MNQQVQPHVMVPTGLRGAPVTQQVEPATMSPAMQSQSAPTGMPPASGHVVGYGASLVEAPATLQHRKHATIPHIEYHDFDNVGRLSEVAIVKRWPNCGSISYIPTESLGRIDKSRLLKLLTQQGAERFALWELLTRTRLNNGINALDFFHPMTKHFRTQDSYGTFSGAVGIEGASHRMADAQIGTSTAVPEDAAQHQSSFQ